jgi:hypothetical protein
MAFIFSIEYKRVFSGVVEIEVIAEKEHRGLWFMNAARPVIG